MALATSQATRDETVHATAKHPWLTTDRDFVPVAHLQMGERVVREYCWGMLISDLRHLATAQAQRKRLATPWAV